MVLQLERMPVGTHNAMTVLQLVHVQDIAIKVKKLLQLVYMQDTLTSNAMLLQWDVMQEVLPKVVVP